MFSLYLNVFVRIAQLSRRVPALKALAPTGSATSFLAVQLAVLVVFLALGTVATVRIPKQSLRTA